MELKDKIEKVIRQLEIDNNWKFTGKYIKGIVYYVFSDGITTTLISSRRMIAWAKEIE